MNESRSCPSCGKSSECDLAAGRSHCWCFDLPVMKATLARVAETSGGDRCLCPDCLKGELAASALSSSSDRPPASLDGAAATE